MTNTTKESKETLLRRLTGIGFDIKAEEVFTSLTAARRLVDQRKLRPMLLLQQDALEDFKGVDVNDPNAVVVGLAPDCFNYESLNKAVRYRTFSGTFLLGVTKTQTSESQKLRVFVTPPFYPRLSTERSVRC